MNVQFVTGRLAILLMVAALLLVPVSSARMMAAARSFDQSLVTVKAKDASLSDILWEIHKQTDFTFVYSTDDIERVVLPSLDFREVTLQKALESCLDSNGLTYTVNGEVITIKPAPSSVKPEGEPVKQNKKYYTGSVVDDAGIPVAGANILVRARESVPCLMRREISPFNMTLILRLWWSLSSVLLQGRSECPPEYLLKSS